MESTNNSIRHGRQPRRSGKGIALIAAGTVLMLGLLLVPVLPERSNSSSEAKSDLPRRISNNTASTYSDSGISRVSPRKRGPAQTRMQYLQEVMEHTTVDSAQLAGYLETNQRNAASLLASFSVTGDTNLLREAMEKYPHDPRVAYTAWFRAETPEQRVEWLTKLKDADPENSLPRYLLANELFKSGPTDVALAELESAWGKSGFTDYAQQSIQDRLEAYTSIGMNAVDATGLAWSQHPLPHLAKLKELGRAIEDLGAGYAQANDPESANVARQMVVQLSDRLKTGQQFLIGDLVGMVIEMHMLNHLDPAHVVNDSGTTASQRLAELTRERDLIKQRSRVTEQALNAASDQDVLAYFNRIQLFGETAATDWLATKYGVVDPGPRPED